MGFDNLNYLVVIFSHLKTTGCFIHKAGLDFNSVKSTFGTKNTLPLLFGIKHHWFDKLPGGYFFLPQNHWLFYS